MCSGVVHAAAPKTALLREAVVHGGSIFLSDLLPTSAPPGVRVPAQEILVGQSPQPGSVRVLSIDTLVRLLDDQNMLNEVDVPEQIVVRRSGHLITNQEVTEAIRATLSRNRMFSTVQIMPEDVRFSAAVLVSTANADLRVTRIELDRTLHQMKFWLVSRADPAILPFMVIARPSGGTAELAKMLGGPAIQAAAVDVKLQSNAPKTESNIADLKPDQKLGLKPDLTLDLKRDLNHERPAQSAAAFVDVGKIANLHLVSGTGSQMFLTATALERGALGQSIRVKIRTTGKILDAHVVGRGQLEAEY